jgi:hypothetical protein
MLALPLGMNGFTYDSLLERTVRSSKKNFRQQESQQLQQSLRASQLNTSNVGGHIEWKPEHFPHKMYDLLEDVERKGLDDIVSWLPDGKSFKIHSQIGFEQSIMPLYFSGMSSYKSFRRQLNLYGIYQHRHRPNQDANGKFTQGLWRSIVAQFVVQVIVVIVQFERTPTLVMNHLLTLCIVAISDTSILPRTSHPRPTPSLRQHRAEENESSQQE